MKWIKKFNEELKPSTYKSAGYKLQRLGKLKRGSKLIDTGNIQETGQFNMHWANNNVIIVNNGKFTSPRLVNFYFGSPETHPAIKYPTFGSAEELVNSWVNGRCDLSFTFEFAFLATEELKLAKPHKELNYYQVPMFSITYQISDWNDGLEEYNTPERFDLPEDQLEKASISDLYGNTTTYEAFLTRPNAVSFGIFSDRKSALAFKKFFDGVVDNNKDKIFDILSIVYPESEELERIVKSLKSIRVNALYEEDLPKSWQNNSWEFWYDRKQQIN